MKKVKKCVIPAAGLGTRFLPATKGTPKEMFPIIDKPTLLFQVEEAVAAGCDEIILIISEAKEYIKEFFKRDSKFEEHLRATGKAEYADEIKRIATMAKITYVYQHEQKGLGHAILCCKEAVGDEPFLVILGDDLVINEGGLCASKQLINAYENTGCSILGVQKVSKEETSKYGIVDPISIDGRLIKMKGMVEKPKDNPPSLFAALGRYLITPDVFGLLEKTTPGAGGEIQLTDALKMMKEIYAYDFEGRRYDIGDKFGYVTATIDFAIKRDDMREKILDYLHNKIA